MKTLYVGGKHFLNRFSSLDAAIARAGHDDTIELHKDLDDVAVYIGKSITINGNGHIIRPKEGKAAFDCGSFVVLNNVEFECRPRTNAVVLKAGGSLSKIVTRIIGPARVLYPTVIQKGGELDMEDSTVMHMETSSDAVTRLKDCTITNYYGGYAYLDDKDVTRSVFRGTTSVTGSSITCTMFEGDTKLSGTTLNNFNKAKGAVSMTSCVLQPMRGAVVKCQDEPVDGPLKNIIQNVTPFALHIAGGRVTSEGHASDDGHGCIGFYMTSGSLDIRHTEAHNDQARHLMKGGAVVFNDVTDDGFYEIKKAACGIIRSRVNTSVEAKTAIEQLNGMIGLASVKKQVRTIMNTVSMNMKNPGKDFGFSRHMVFAGDPGTGKTTVAKLVAQAMFEIGAIPENKCMEVPASQLVKGYVGQTGAHVEEVLKKAVGGVLFIDEAYELMVRDGQNTFNNDAIAVLLRYMEDHRHDLVVIAAGYEKEMREFLASNVGLTRRFQWVSFEDYAPGEMADIFLGMAAKYDERFCFGNAKDVIGECFTELTSFYLSHPDMRGRTTNGGNGGLVRNLFQQVVFARNNRLADDPASTSGITMSDIRAGFLEEMDKARNVQSM